MSVGLRPPSHHKSGETFSPRLTRASHPDRRAAGKAAEASGVQDGLHRTGHQSPIALLARLKAIGPPPRCSILKVSTGALPTEVAAYAGLVPTPRRSGDDREQGISKAGNRRLRHIMIELAWLWVRHQPTSTPSRWFRARVGTDRGRIRRIAIVALARKLLIALWSGVT